MAIDAGQGDFVVTPKLSADFEQKLIKEIGQAVAKAETSVAKAAKGIKSKVDIDTEGAVRATKNFGTVLENATKRADAHLTKLGLSVRDLAVITGAGLTANVLVAGLRLLVEFSQKALVAYRDLEEAISASEIIFGGASDRVIEFGAQAAENLGLSQRAALQSATAFSSLFESMNLTEGQVADLSVGLVKLSADITSLRNLDPTNTQRNLRSFLAGEAESGRILGILASEEAVRSKAREEGLIRGSEALSEQQKVLVRYQIALEQTRVAQGNFIQTSEELANQERFTAARLENASARFGEAIAPGKVAFLNALTDIVEGIEYAVDRWRNWISEVKSGINELAQFIGKNILDPILPDLSKAEKERLRVALNLAQSEEVVADKVAEVKLEYDKLSGTLKAVATNQLTAEEAEKRYNKQLEAGVEVIKAAVALEGARLGLKGAQLDVARAEEELAQTRERASRTLVSSIATETRSNLLKAQGARVTDELSSALGQLANLQNDVNLSSRTFVTAMQAAINVEKERINLDKAKFALPDALEDEAKAIRDVAEAERELAEVRADEGRQIRQVEISLDLAEAQLRIQETALGATAALLALARAERGLFTAQRDLERAQRRGNLGREEEREAAFKLREAELGLADARLEPERNRLAQLRAELELQKALKAAQEEASGENQARLEQEAVDALNAARRTQRDATFAVREAQFALTEQSLALRGAEFALADILLRARTETFDLAQAELSLAQARLGVDEAVIAIADATQKLAEKEAEAAGEELKAADSVRIWREQLGLFSEEIQPAGTLYTRLSQFNELVNSIPTEVTVKVETEGTKEAGEEIDTLGKKIARWIDDLSAKLFGPSIERFGGSESDFNFDRPPEGRMAGGPVLPGHTYVVGERARPELLTMGREGGWVTDRREIQGNGGEQHFNFQFLIQKAMDLDPAAARRWAFLLMREWKR